MRVILGSSSASVRAQAVVDDLVGAFTQPRPNRQVKYGNGIGGLSIAAPPPPAPLHRDANAEAQQLRRLRRGGLRVRRARLWVARALVGRGRRRSGDAMSSASQNAAIRVHHPGFRRTLKLGFVVKWRGEVRPISRPYTIEVEYRPRRGLVSVRVLKPDLVLKRPGAEPITHVYRSRLRSGRPSLCLFDPREGEWTPRMPIAEDDHPVGCRVAALLTKSGS